MTVGICMCTRSTWRKHQEEEEERRSMRRHRVVVVSGRWSVNVKAKQHSLVLAIARENSPGILVNDSEDDGKV